MEYNFNWIVAIIKSCNNNFHFDSVDILIDLFFAKHGNVELTDALKQLRQNHWLHIHSILN